MRLTAFDWSLISIVLAVLIATLEKLKAIREWMISLFFVTKKCNTPLAWILLNYLYEKSKVDPQVGSYGCVKLPVKVLASIVNIPYKALWASKKRFRYNRRFVWFLFDSDDPVNRNIWEFNSQESVHTYVFPFGFIRWTLDWEKLVKDAIDWATMKAEGESRFKVVRIQSSKKQGGMGSVSPPRKVIVKSSFFSTTSAHVPLTWTAEEIGKSDGGNDLSDMYLTEDAESAALEIKNWYSSKMWFYERGIPWTRKYGLGGEPGTGKTSFARAVAHELGIPIFSIDLASMSNEMLLDAWDDACSNAPCIILLEDIDAVFKGRQNMVTDDDALTFDCLLNCIDGVKQNGSGLLVMMSSNHIDDLDPALKRPGRMDRVINFTRINKAGMKKIAERIIGDAEAADKIVGATEEGLTPAAFQEVCFREALNHRFGMQESGN